MTEPQLAPPDAGVPPAGNPPEKKSGGLFGGGKAKPSAGITTNELAAELNNVSRRLMILEERYTGLRKKTQVTDQNMLTTNKNMITEIKISNSEVDDLRKDLKEMRNNFKIMIQEIKNCAKKQDLTVLTKYVDMWEPINFITRKEVDRIIEEQVLAQMEDLNLKLQQENYIKEQIKMAMTNTKKPMKK